MSKSLKTATNYTVEVPTRLETERTGLTSSVSRTASVEPDEEEETVEVVEPTAASPSQVVTPATSDTLESTPDLPPPVPVTSPFFRNNCSVGTHFLNALFHILYDNLVVSLRKNSGNWRRCWGIPIQEIFP